MCEEMSDEDIMKAAADIVDRKLNQVRQLMEELHDQIDWESRDRGCDPTKPTLREKYDQAWMIEQQLESFPIIVDFFENWWVEGELVNDKN